MSIARSVPLAFIYSESAYRCTQARQSRLTAAQRVAAQKACQSGKSMAALATDYQVTRLTISQILRRSSITVREPQTISTVQIDEAAGLYRDGWSLEQIGARLRFDHKTIHRHLLKCGVSM